jgi:hypothetical protein
MFIVCVILRNFQILSDSCYAMKMGPAFVNRRETNRRMWFIAVFIVLTVWFILCHDLYMSYRLPLPPAYTPFVGFIDTVHSAQHDV